MPNLKDYLYEQLGIPQLEIQQPRPTPFMEEVPGIRTFAERLQSLPFELFKGLQGGGALGALPIKMLPPPPDPSKPPSKGFHVPTVEEVADWVGEYIPEFAVAALTPAGASAELSARLGPTAGRIAFGALEGGAIEGMFGRPVGPGLAAGTLGGGAGRVLGKLGEKFGRAPQRTALEEAAQLSKVPEPSLDEVTTQLRTLRESLFKAEGTPELSQLAEGEAMKRAAIEQFRAALEFETTGKISEETTKNLNDIIGALPAEAAEHVANMLDTLPVDAKARFAAGLHKKLCGL